MDGRLQLCLPEVKRELNGVLKEAPNNEPASYTSYLLLVLPTDMRYAASYELLLRGMDGAWVVVDARRNLFQSKNFAWTICVPQTGNAQLGPATISKLLPVILRLGQSVIPQNTQNLGLVYGYLG